MNFRQRNMMWRLYFTKIALEAFGVTIIPSISTPSPVMDTSPCHSMQIQTPNHGLLRATRKPNIQNQVPNMHFIKSIRIEGFWGDKSVNIDFDPEVNFLIGVNGSGKTTIINLISAILRCDYSYLAHSPFNFAEIRLGSHQHKKIPVIEVEKDSSSKARFSQIDFRVRDMVSGERTTYSPDDFYTQMDLLQHYEEDYLRSRRHNRKSYEHRQELLERLNSLVNITWLSIHRSSVSRQRSDEESYDTTVDRKTQEIANSFARYFSLLAANAADETRKFQEFMFLSLLYKQRAGFGQFSEIDVSSEKAEIIKIFKQFGLNEKDFMSPVNSHFRAVQKAQETLRSDERIGLEHITALTDTMRVHDVVEEWQMLQQRHTNIFSPKTQFLEIINKLFVRKSLSFNERNQPVVETQSGKTFGPEYLSSGEKQLFILLGETLLQENAPCIFIADEPELSLHVSWQSEIVRNMVALNPSAQLIFATHSPDVVGPFSKNVIKIEGCINDLS